MESKLRAFTFQNAFCNHSSGNVVGGGDVQIINAQKPAALQLHESSVMVFTPVHHNLLV